MTYPVQLDEIPEKVLRAEIKRLLNLRAEKRCDYCERPVDTGACRFPERHRIRKGLHIRFEVARETQREKHARIARGEGR